MDQSLKRTYEQTKQEKRELINKCRRLRLERKEKQETLLRESKDSLLLNSNEIVPLSGKSLDHQVQMWRAMAAAGLAVDNIEILKGYREKTCTVGLSIQNQ